jgi:hypothetical protein
VGVREVARKLHVLDTPEVAAQAYAAKFAAQDGLSNRLRFVVLEACLAGFRSR